MATINTEYTNKCPNCDGVMAHDEAREVLECPYCGYIVKVAESDDVKQARIKAAADVERQKIQSDYDLKRDKIQSGVDSLREGARIVNEGAEIVRTVDKVTDTARSIVKLFVVMAIIGVICLFLIIGCIAMKAFG